MKVQLHKLARTTPAIRREIQMSGEISNSVLAKKYGVDISTIRKWKSRKSVEDLSHTRHNLGASTNAVEEELIGDLRTRLCLSVDDITEVMKRCVNSKLSRSSIYI